MKKNKIIILQKLFLTFILLVGLITVISCGGGDGGGGDGGVGVNGENGGDSDPAGNNNDYTPAYRIPDTGQTQSYTSTAGEDSDYTYNPPSYTKLDADNNELPDSASSWHMVRDNNTGLIWEVKQNMDGSPDYTNHNDADNTYTWFDSNSATNGGASGTSGNDTDSEDFINALNAENFGDFNDWRLPTIRELIYIGNHQTLYPAIDTSFFPNTYGSGPYFNFTSTTNAEFPDLVHTVLFGTCTAGAQDKSDSGYIRAVRGEIFCPSNNFTDNGDDTITDYSTGLMWQQVVPAIEMDWEAALNYCEDLSLAGYDDWRLPNINELVSILNYSYDNAFIDTTYFIYNPNNLNLWSSTISEVVGSDILAYSIPINNGHVTSRLLTNTYYVISVRNDQ